VEPTLGLVTRHYFLSEGFCLKVTVLSVWGTLSNERTDLQFEVQLLNGPSRAKPITILYCLIWDSSNLEGQVPVFISHRNMVAQLYPLSTVFPLLKLLPLAELQWSYSNLPPHGDTLWMPVSYTLLVSQMWPNGFWCCYAPRRLARLTRRLVLWVKLLCGKFPHVVTVHLCKVLKQVNCSSANLHKMPNHTLPVVSRRM
jgi:hypothetical protein